MKFLKALPAAAIAEQEFKTRATIRVGDFAQRQITRVEGSDIGKFTAHRLEGLFTFERWMAGVLFLSPILLILVNGWPEGMGEQYQRLP